MNGKWTAFSSLGDHSKGFTSQVGIRPFIHGHLFIWSHREQYLSWMYVGCLAPRPRKFCHVSCRGSRLNHGPSDWWMTALPPEPQPALRHKQIQHATNRVLQGWCVFLRLTPEVRGVRRFQPQAAAEIFWWDFWLLQTVGSVACFVQRHNLHFYVIEQNGNILGVKYRRVHSNYPKVCIELCNDIMQCNTKHPC